MKRPMLKVSSIVAVAGLVAMACGSSKSNSSSTSTTGGSSATTAAGGTTPVTTTSKSASEATKNDPLIGPAGTGKTRGITDTTIKVGCEFNQAQFTGADDGYKARFERANRDNELFGRKIEFSACQDDGSNTQNNLTIAKRLVEQDNVFAIMSISANELPGTTDYLGQQEVPYYGWGFLPGFCAQRWGYGFNGCLIANYSPDQKHVVLQAALADPPIKASGLQPKDVRVAIQDGEDDSGKIAQGGYQQLFELRGTTVVYNKANMPVPGPPADFSPFVTDVMSGNPNLVITSVNFQSFAGFTAALTQGGFKGTNANFVGYVPGLLGSPAGAQLAAALSGAYVVTQIVPQEQETDYIKQIESDLTAINAKTGKFISLSAAIAYAQAEMLVEQLKAVGKDLNTKTFDQKVNGGSFTFQSPKAGGPGKLDFPSGHFIPADCAAVVKVVGTEYKVSVPFSCYQSPVVKGT
jgi:ABC-type branched-subunit amino acid transport system substrate-binding protein